MDRFNKLYLLTRQFAGKSTEEQVAVSFDGGERVERREEFSPTLYVPSKKETEYKTLEGNYVEPVKLGNIKDAKEFVQCLFDQP